MAKSLNSGNGILLPMGIILIRYGELALKSRPVRLRFERTLMRNIEELFLLEKRECLLSREWGRMMAHVGDDAAAGKILGRVFGITSFSPAIETPSEIHNVAEVAARRSAALLKDGQSFAIRARRTGTHPYNSQQLAALAGSAVMEANKGRGIRVDLSDPDVEIFIEVRGKTAYIFPEKFPGPGGLPMGTQGRVAALLTGEASAAAAWLMMKRGCRVMVVGRVPGAGCRGPDDMDEGAKRSLEMLLPWAPHLSLHALPDVSMDALERFASRRRAEALVLGSTYDELNNDIPQAGMPVLHPLCGMGPVEIFGLIEKIRAG
jgi:thiamine biosynthesis protein ThiI